MTFDLLLSEPNIPSSCSNPPLLILHVWHPHAFTLMHGIHWLPFIREPECRAVSPSHLLWIMETERLCSNLLMTAILFSCCLILASRQSELLWKSEAGRNWRNQFNKSRLCFFLPPHVPHAVCFLSHSVIQSQWGMEEKATNYCSKASFWIIKLFYSFCFPFPDAQQAEKTWDCHMHIFTVSVFRTSLSKDKITLPIHHHAPFLPSIPVSTGDSFFVAAASSNSGLVRQIRGELVTTIELTFSHRQVIDGAERIILPGSHSFVFPSNRNQILC